MGLTKAETDSNDNKIAKHNRGVCFLHRQVGGGRVTIAYQPGPGMPGVTNVGIAWCSPLERNWSRAKGREIATRRLRHGAIPCPDGRRRKLTIHTQATLRTVMVETMWAAIRADIAPSWAKQALLRAPVVEAAE